MIRKTLITGAFLALCSTAAAVPAKNLALCARENVHAWLKASNAKTSYEASLHKHLATIDYQLEEEKLLDAIEKNAIENTKQALRDRGGTTIPSDAALKEQFKEERNARTGVFKIDSINSQTVQNNALARFVDFTNLAKVPLFATPRTLMAHAAAWALATRVFEDKISIADATKTTGLSLAGATSAALMITLSNHIKVSGYRQSDKTSKALLALSAIPYLMGQNPEFTTKTFKTAKVLGFKGSLETMLRTITTGFSKKGSAKSRALFVARTFGPFLTGLCLTDKK